jgi:cytochrome c peroxidase
VLVLALAACPKSSDKKPAEPAKREDAAPVADAAPVVLAPAPPLPAVPAGLPALPAQPGVTPEAVALGELLFWDARLSHNGKVACATCHVPTEGYAGSGRQDTALAKPNLRRASPLVNVAWQKDYAWDGRYSALAEQLAAHVRGQLGDDLAAAVARIVEVPGYRAHFARFATSSPGDAALAALGAFVLTRYAGDAPWDRLERAPDVPADVKAGHQVFTAKAQCAVCHTPPLYTDLRYHRLGVIAIADEGRGHVDSALQGAFRTPTLRGAAQRAGFFHDGSATSLDAAIDWHLAGGTGQNADPTIVDPALKKVTLTPAERAQLVAFVRALTDSAQPVPVRPTLP